MALIIEDGTIVADANSVATVAEYRAYLLVIGIDTSADVDATVEAYLIGAMRFIDQRYEPRLQGYRVDSTQTLCMPRNYMVVRNFHIDNNVIPDDFKNAQILAAYKIKSGDDLSPDIIQGKSITKEKKKLDVLEVETEYSENPNNPNEQLNKFTEIEEILFSYFKPRSTMYRLYR